MQYQKDILILNHCLFSRLAGTTLVRDDSVLVLNLRNPGHQQSNLCFRLRLQLESFSTFLHETLAAFTRAGIQPRYIIDSLVTPSLETVVDAFEQAEFHVERDQDIILSWEEANHIPVPSSKRVLARKATENDRDALCALFGLAFGYSEVDWLTYKIQCQLDDPRTFPVYLIEQDGKVASATILNLPPGLTIGHVNVCATHPDYQRQGLAAACLDQALLKEARGRKMYLEVYDEIIHAQRMYQQLGFRIEGPLACFAATKK
ncbi:hypothetical protein DFQ28_004766 [Apophysomyces sp. BC1034]|nr:hypothetical protein DFQ30_004631 [Apophysomyces sp. BC1015]KAG0178262.1 hypothetical protein DFQ29_003699 [Apophysomyces sp. BC1021]KAG0188503.1 hypothetical protein DFQ28_004766 [Apophysomyces sp. BC1034]